jgi:citrate synthase
VLEQIEDNRIFRPLAHYDGPAAPRELPGFWQPGTP